VFAVQRVAIREPKRACLAGNLPRPRIRAPDRRAFRDADSSESASRKAAPPGARLHVRDLAADPRRIDRFASGRRLRPDRESAHRIGARSV